LAFLRGLDDSASKRNDHLHVVQNRCPQRDHTCHRCIFAKHPPARLSGFVAATVEFGTHAISAKACDDH
jgi:hypothetical protein